MTGRTINGYVVWPGRLAVYEDPRANGYVYEHREVAAASLGRSLSADEHVHHDDENRGNNTPTNLFVFRTNADHLRYHATGVRIDMGDGTWTSPEQPPAFCRDCGTPIVQNSPRCIPCSQVALRRVTRPPADELRGLVWSMPTVAVAAKFGVSDVAVAKWCKALGVDKPPRGYWAKQAALAREKSGAPGENRTPVYSP